MRRTARRLDAALAGEQLVRAELRVPRFALAQLRGMTVIGTDVLGKHLLTRLTGREGAWTLHHHLRLDGNWRTGVPGAPPRFAGVRVWLVTTRAQAVGVRVHMVEMVRTCEEDRLVGHLGPDIMAAGFDPGDAAQRLRDSGSALVEALLDQRLVAGMGTMWAAELAATARAHPRTPIDEVADLPGALQLIRQQMLDAVDAPAIARRRLLVFQRAGHPCRGCGSAILAGRVGRAPMDRPTYWCPRCQPGPQLRS